MTVVEHREVALVDLLDRLLAGGVVIAGDITLRIADVDLVGIDLNALISSVNAKVPLGGSRCDREEPTGPRSRHGGARPRQTVLTVVELLRQLMERQALRRFETGELTDDQEERIGLTLMLLDDRMTELRERYGLRPADLNLDLGPLGPLPPK